METQFILDQLLDLLRDNGISVRLEALGGTGGGLCKLKNKHVFYLDTEASAVQNAHISAKAVFKTVDIENVYLRPQIREFIENTIPADDQSKTRQIQD